MNNMVMYRIILKKLLSIISKFLYKKSLSVAKYLLSTNELFKLE